MKKLLFLIILIVTLILAGCKNGFLITTKDNNQTTTKGNITTTIEEPSTTIEEPSTTLEESSTTSEDITTNNTEQYQSLTYYDISNTYGYEWKFLNSIGTANILIIPVTIDGYQEYATDIVKHNIETTFFGEKEDTLYNSVKSFYEESSYGKFTVDGYCLDFTDRVFTKDELKNDEDPILEYTDEYLQELEIDPKDFDTDSDGYIDLVVYIFSSPVYDQVLYRNVPDYFWAYTANADNESDIDNPKVNNYMLASAAFMYDNDGLDLTPSLDYKVDAHTYIHEMGHTLGLDDYYNADYRENRDNYYPGDPTGQTTMMDGNISDFDPFSKLALGWIDSVLLYDSSVDEITFTLNSLSTTSEALIIGHNYNGNAFSEYFILEYYTPTGINEWDANNTIDYLYGINEAGIKLYYVDARLGMLDGKKLVELTNSSDFDDDSNNALSITCRSNTPTYSLFYTDGYDIKKANEKLLTVISKENKDFLSDYETFTEDDLFVSGDSYDLSTYITHSNDTYDYTITFSEQEEDSIKVTITKNTNNQ